MSKSVPFSEALSEFPEIFPASLSRRTALLILSGCGPQKRLWAVDHLTESRPPAFATFGISGEPSILIGLVASFLRLALQATTARAELTFVLNGVTLEDGAIAVRESDERFVNLHRFLPRFFLQRRKRAAVYL